jgi:hypothetical protein
MTRFVVARDRGQCTFFPSGWMINCAREQTGLLVVIQYLSERLRDYFPFTADRVQLQQVVLTCS